MSQTGNGTIDMYTERITLAQDSPGVVTLGTGNVTLSSILDTQEDLAPSKATVHVGVATNVDNVITKTGLGKVDMQGGSFHDITLEIEATAGGIAGADSTLSVYYEESGASIGLATAMVQIQRWNELDITIPSAVADGSILRDTTAVYSPGARYQYVGYTCANLGTALSTVLVWINKN